VLEGLVCWIGVFTGLKSNEHFFREECEVVVVAFAFVLYWGSGEHVGRCVQFAWYVLDH
jgi:hypothetical protein